MLFTWGMICLIVGLFFSPLLIGVPILWLSGAFFFCSFCKNAFAPGKSQKVKNEQPVERSKVETLDDWE
ncbi:hypothetical protein NDI36_27430 [Leptolyngbya boryana FACHB-1624]|uniref:hypothetical protein n=1 Tax=Leptolyngbya sp. FACHB-1624 TaxID=2692802 RepID=UPI0016842865|nr:hypothetical protein [Leptolyngbya sp. FACHB-1624]MBD1854545.1 hypothetical protein [Leptolyngbya sp. FACHB-1624]